MFSPSGIFPSGASKRTHENDGSGEYPIFKPAPSSDERNNSTPSSHQRSKKFRSSSQFELDNEEKDSFGPLLLPTLQFNPYMVPEPYHLPPKAPKHVAEKTPQVPVKSAPIEVVTLPTLSTSTLSPPVEKAQSNSLQLNFPLIEANSLSLASHPFFHNNIPNPPSMDGATTSDLFPQGDNYHPVQNNQEQNTFVFSLQNTPSLDLNSYEFQTRQLREYIRKTQSLILYSTHQNNNNNNNNNTHPDIFSRTIGPLHQRDVTSTLHNTNSNFVSRNGKYVEPSSSTVIKVKFILTNFNNQIVTMQLPIGLCLNSLLFGESGMFHGLGYYIDPQPCENNQNKDYFPAKSEVINVSIATPSLEHIGALYKNVKNLEGVNNGIDDGFNWVPVMGKEANGFWNRQDDVMLHAITLKSLMFLQWREYKQTKQNQFDLEIAIRW
jgi:hypothetical protein